MELKLETCALVTKGPVFLYLGVLQAHKLCLLNCYEWFPGPQRVDMGTTCTTICLKKFFLKQTTMRNNNSSQPLLSFESWEVIKTLFRENNHPRRQFLKVQGERETPSLRFLLFLLRLEVNCSRCAVLKFMWPLSILILLSIFMATVAMVLCALYIA